MSESEPEPESPDTESSPEPSESGSTPESSESGSTPESSGSEPASGPTEDGEEPEIGATLGLFSGDRGGGRAGTGGGRRGRSIRTAGAASSDGGSVDGPRTAGRSGERGGPTSGTSSWYSTGTVGSTDAGTDADEGVVAALVAELREGSASDEEVEALRRGLGVAPTASDDVRIEHLQARVGEFEAYAEDLGAVIDEYGSAEAFVDRFEGRLDGLSDDLGAVEAELSATRDALERIEDRLEALEAFREEFSTVFAEHGDDPD